MLNWSDEVFDLALNAAVEFWVVGVSDAAQVRAQASCLLH